MTRNQELTALAHEFSDKLLPRLTTKPNAGTLHLDNFGLVDIVTIYYRPGVVGLRVWDWTEPYEAWTDEDFGDTPEGWQRAKLAFREAAFAEMKGSTNA